MEVNPFESPRTLETLPQAPAIPENSPHTTAMRNGAGWFYWIAGASIINSVILVCNGSLNFLLGLWITNVISALAAEWTKEEDPTIRMATLAFALAASVGISCLFIGLGYLASNGHGWAFVVGMIIYACDGIFFLLTGEILAIALHGFALYSLFMGLRAKWELDKLRQQQVVVPGTF